MRELPNISRPCLAHSFALPHKKAEKGGRTAAGARKLLVFSARICYNEYKKTEESVFGSESVLSREEAKLLSPVVLAFVGDAVYTLYVRERLILSGGGRAADFQRAASRVVSAHGQSEFLETLLPRFTEEEAEVFRRGRNAKKATKSKNASVSEYNRSTGFEAVLGFLYLTGDFGRIGELLAAGGEEEYELPAVHRPFRPGR